MEVPATPSPLCFLEVPLTRNQWCYNGGRLASVFPCVHRPRCGCLVNSAADPFRRSHKLVGSDVRLRSSRCGGMGAAVRSESIVRDHIEIIRGASWVFVEIGGISLSISTPPNFVDSLPQKFSILRKRSDFRYKLRFRPLVRRTALPGPQMERPSIIRRWNHR